MKVDVVSCSFLVKLTLITYKKNNKDNFISYIIIIDAYLISYC